jgi:hypothetical protein
MVGNSPTTSKKKNINPKQKILASAPGCVDTLGGMQDAYCMRSLLDT